MNIIDTILNKLGLQRKSTITPDTTPQGTPPPQKEEETPFMASVHRMMERSQKISDKATEAAMDLVEVRVEWEAKLVKEFVEKVRAGTLTPKENEFYINALFGKTDTSELSPEIQQALRDALEKRGREDEDEDS